MILWKNCPYFDLAVVVLVLKECSARLAVQHTCLDTTEGAWPIQIKEIGCEGVEWVFCAHDMACR